MVRARPSFVWVATVALLGAVAAPAAAATNGDAESSNYSGPEEVTESLTESEALESLDPPPVVPQAPLGRDVGSQITPQCIACVEWEPASTKVVSGPVLVKKRFVRYLTSAWAYSTGYTWSNTTTVSATVSADVGLSAEGISTKIGVAKSRSQSYTVAVSIYASKSRLSKLGLYSDYHRYYVKHRKAYMSGLTPPAWKYAYLYSPRADQYLITTYKS